MARTIPPKEDKVGTSSSEGPTAQALAAQSGSKVPDDTLTDDDPDLLNFDEAESEITYRMSSQLWSCWPDSGKPDYAVWDSEWSGSHSPDAGPTFFVLGHEDVEGGLWAAF
jgi:hypothetical protein